MSTKVSPTLIGAFVIGAVALIVIAILLLGSGRLFRQTRDFVLYFDNSVNGLRVGAPVKFKGVEVGSVKDIRLQLEKGAEVNKIPVIIEIDLEKLTLRGATPEIAVDREAFHKAVVDGTPRATRDGELGYRSALCRSRFFSRNPDQFCPARERQ